MIEFDRIAAAEHVHKMTPRCRARGHGEEALRLADKHKVPNAICMDLGVELSSDPKKAPKLKIG